MSLAGGNGQSPSHAPEKNGLHPPAELPPPPSPQLTAPTSDRGWVIGWSVFVVMLSFAPFVLAYYVQPNNGRFMGLLWNALDGNVYLSKMEAGRRGEWLFHLTFTSEEHPGILVYTHYYLLGKLAGLINLPNVLVFHLARLATGALLLWASWRFICRYFAESRMRRTAFLLVCFGAGLGWLVGPIGLKDSTDLWVAESLTFFSILAQPHYPLATALLLAGFMSLQEGWETDEAKKAGRAFAKAAACGLLLSFIHPFLVITLGVIAGLYLLRRTITMRRIEWRHWFGLILVGVFALPIPIYIFLATSNDPIYKGWMSQNQTYSPLPFFYMLGYGLLFGLAVIGGWWAERRSPLETRSRWQFVTTWVIGTAVLLYVPVNFQRRFIEGLHLPIVLLATAGFYFLARQWRPAIQHRRANLLVILTALTTLLVLGTFFGNVFARSEDGDFHPLFLYGEEVTAMNWLKNNTALTDTVIAGPITGSYIPAFAGNRTFYGHDLETINRDQKIEQLRRFFQFQMTREETMQFARQYGIRYVYFGPEEARLFAQRNTDDTEEAPPDLQELGWLPVYVNSKVQIYRISN